MIEGLYKKIKQGDSRAIAKTITLIESTLDADRKLALALLTKLQVGKNQKSIRIGISGIPGVGKSSFIEKIGTHILHADSKIKIAILTVDPSSPLQGGSILADRLRMTTLSQNSRVFIRPSPASGSQGGLSRRTRECMLLLEACGYDLIFVETVGVGQTEYQVSSLVDIFLLLQMPSTGDEWQAMKKGILELADIILIHKADGNLLNESKKLQKILQLTFPSNVQNGTLIIQTCSSLLNQGIAEAWISVKDFIKKSRDSDNFLKKRRLQNLFWFEDELLALFKNAVETNSKIRDSLLPIKERLMISDQTLFALEAEQALESLLRVDFLS
jgi:LAO/AO transport system kinase